MASINLFTEDELNSSLDIGELGDFGIPDFDDVLLKDSAGVPLFQLNEPVSVASDQVAVVNLDTIQTLMGGVKSPGQRDPALGVEAQLRGGEDSSFFVFGVNPKEGLGGGCGQVLTPREPESPEVPENVTSTPTAEASPKKRRRNRGKTQKVFAYQRDDNTKQTRSAKQAKTNRDLQKQKMENLKQLLEDATRELADLKEKESKRIKDLETENEGLKVKIAGMKDLEVNLHKKEERIKGLETQLAEVGQPSLSKGATVFLNDFLEGLMSQNPGSRITVESPSGGELRAAHLTKADKEVIRKEGSLGIPVTIKQTYVFQMQLPKGSEK